MTENRSGVTSYQPWKVWVMVSRGKKRNDPGQVGLIKPAEIFLYDWTGFVFLGSCWIFFLLFFLFSVPEFTVNASHPVLNTTCALHNTHHQAHPAPHPPSLQNPQIVSQSSQSFMVHLPLQFPATYFSPLPNVLCVIPYAPQISKTI